MKKTVSVMLLICVMVSILFNFTICVEGAISVPASTIVENAKSLIDQYPYVWGGESPEEGGFDCSGFVWYVYHVLSGIDITLEQAGRSYSALANAGTKISGISNFLPGDIVQFDYPHVAVYIGDNTIVEAQKSGTRIKYRTINSNSQVSYAIRLSSVIQDNGSYTPTPLPTPTPTPTTSASISLSKTYLDLDLSSKPSDTVGISLSGNLPSRYRLDFDCSSSVRIVWGGWTNNNKNNSITVTATTNTQNGSTATIYLRDDDGNTYATKDFTIYVTGRQKEDAKLELSSTSIGIDHVNNPNATVSVYASGTLPESCYLSAESGPAVSTKWSNNEGQNATLNITANWRLGENDETVTVMLLDGNKNVLSKKNIRVYSTTKKYIVTFNANGGFNEPDYLMKYEGSDCMIPYEIPKREGYEFLGWAISEYANQPDYKCGDRYYKNKDTILYAVWDKNDYSIDLSTEDIYAYDTYLNLGTSKYGEIDLVATGLKNEGYEYTLDSESDNAYLIISTGDETIRNGVMTTTISIYGHNDNECEDITATIYLVKGVERVQEKKIHIHLRSSKAEMNSSDIASQKVTNDIAVYVDGEIIDFDVRPQLINDRTMVPMRAIFEALGATVTWDGNAQTAKGWLNGINVSISIGQSVLYRNGAAVYLDSPATIIDSRTLVPIRAIAESFDCGVDWDGDTRTVYINSNYADTDEILAEESYEYEEIPSIDKSSYLKEILENSKRVWQDFEEMSDIPEREIVVSSINQNNIVFSLEFYRLDGFENISAKIDNEGIIYFENISGYANGNISGNIKAIDGNLVLTITNSNHPYFNNGEKYTFSRQSDESVLQ